MATISLRSLGVGLPTPPSFFCFVLRFSDGHAHGIVTATPGGPVMTMYTYDPLYGLKVRLLGDGLLTEPGCDRQA
ncbi:MAG TPA: hypothetical protein VF784_10980 [Anaerolineales bacterium]